jgi:hypothetical protein
MRAPSPRRLRRTALCSVAVALLSSCGGSGFQYVHDRSTETFVRVPDDWSMFTQNEILGTGNALNPFAEPGNHIEFMRSFSADPAVGPASIPDFSAERPQGYLLVEELNPVARDEVSLGVLRNSFLPVDQIYSTFPGDIAFFTRDENLDSEGFQGSHLVYTIQRATIARYLGQSALDFPADSVTINQTALVDPTLSRTYLLVIMCTSNCYQDNETTIDLIANSLKVKEPT